MIQRFLYTALVDGIAKFTADPTLFDHLFLDEEGYGLSETEVDAIKQLWDEKPPNVNHGYAPRELEMPSWNIILSNENESATWLNNDVGQVDTIGDDDFGVDIKGSQWTHRYDLLIYSEHPDATQYYYEVAKSILLVSNDYFVEKALYDIDISGADLAPDRRYLPEHLFARRITFSCNRVFERLDRDSRFQKAFRVSGIHIDRSGSPSDVGDVKTLVTLNVEGE
jgi:hypothetical protein